MVAPTNARFPGGSLREGFGGLGLATERTDQLCGVIRRWWVDPYRTWCREPILGLVEAGSFAELADAFGQALPFGTGGRRGRVGVGPNRINPYTVAETATGHAVWLAGRFSTPLAVVLAWDVRAFADVNNIYGGRAGALLGMSSEDLARVAADVYAAHGIATYALSPGHPGWVSTPLLSYAIRLLGAQGGVNVSASHNPPDDNGVKVYAEHGGQLVPPHDADLLSAMTGGGGIHQVPSQPLQLPDDLQTRWVRDLVGSARATNLSVRYSPLHGTGVVDVVLRHMNCRVERYGPQSEPDPLFATVPGGVANPERPEVYDHGLRGCEADLYLVTDPDADRLGVAVNTPEGWHILDGHSLAALIVDGALRVQSSESRTPLVIRTRVTTSLVDRIAAAAGALCVNELLVGFKYIGGVLAKLDSGSWNGLNARDVRFVVGVEESLGALCTDVVRDKDAASAAVAVAVAASEAKSHGLTLVERLQQLWWCHGYIRNRTVRVRVPGVAGKQRLRQIMAAQRSTPAATMAGRRVCAFRDLQDPSGELGPHKSETDAASRDLLEFELEAGTVDEGARVVLRPSGTEPLLKMYIEVRGHAELDVVGRHAVDNAVQSLADWLTAAFG